MADVTISDLNNLTPVGTSVIPISNGVTTGKATIASLPVDYNNLTNKPSLAAVATSGSYNDLTNKPTIPSVNSAQLAKAWVNFAGNAGTTVGSEFRCTVRSSFNVDRVVRTSTGNFRVYFTTAMPDTNYTINATANTLSSPICFFVGPLNGAITTTYFDIRVINFNNGPADPSIISVIVYGL